MDGGVAQVVGIGRLGAQHIHHEHRRQRHKGTSHNTSESNRKRGHTSCQNLTHINTYAQYLPITQHNKRLNCEYVRTVSLYIENNKCRPRSQSMELPTTSLLLSVFRWKTKQVWGWIDAYFLVEKAGVNSTPNSLCFQSSV